MKSGMVTNFRSNSSINIVNEQDIQSAKVENSLLNVDLHKATESTINLLESELNKKGIKNNKDSKKKIFVSVENFYFSDYFMVVGCTSTIKVKTSDGTTKTFQEHNNSGIGLAQACNFAITKTIASIINDEYIRSFINSDSSHQINHREKLAKLKELFKEGLITKEEYDSKRGDIIKSI